MNYPEGARVLNLIGLLLGFAGTVVVWFNTAPAGGQASYWMDGDASRQVAEAGAKAQRRLRLGLGLLAVGFALQFAGEVL